MEIGEKRERLDVWFASDIENVLRAVAYAGEGRHEDYFHALQAIALAFGTQTEVKPRRELIPGPSDRRTSLPFDSVGRRKRNGYSGA